MVLGHFAVSLAAKRAEPKTSLGLYILGAQCADLLWPIFLALGWERVAIVPGITRFTPLDFIWYPYSHSLAAELLWGALLGGIYYIVRRRMKAAALLAICVPSHWLLDFISHRPDMPLVPGGTRYGLDLWNHPAATIVVELALFAAGTTLYLTGLRPKTRTRRYALWALLLLLVAIFFGAAFGPPPPDLTTLEVSAFAIWLTLPWAAWADWHSERRAPLLEN
jgi:hypothetical protein